MWFPAGHVIAGTVALGGVRALPTRDFSANQWRWHVAWLARQAAYRQATAPPATLQGQATTAADAPLAQTQLGAAGGGVKTPSASVAAAAAGGAAEGGANSLETRLWPRIEVRFSL